MEGKKKRTRERGTYEQANKEKKILRKKIRGRANKMKWIKRCAEKYKEEVSKNNVKIGTKGQSRQRQIKNPTHQERKMKEGAGWELLQRRKSIEKWKDKWGEEEMEEAINKIKRTDVNKEKRTEKKFNSCLINIILKKH